MKMKCPYFCSLRTTEEVNIRFRQMILNRVRSFQKILFTNESMCTNNIISIGLQTNIHFYVPYLCLLVRLAFVANVVNKLYSQLPIVWGIHW